MSRDRLTKSTGHQVYCCGHGVYYARHKTIKEVTVNPSESASTESPRAFPGVPATLRSTVRSSGTDTKRWASCEARLELALGDLTTETTDAIVNPVGAGLVDLAVRRAAGPDLLDAYHQAAATVPGGRLLAGRALV